MVERVFLVHRSRGKPADGIRDHGDRLASELSSLGIAVERVPDFGRGEMRAWLGLWRRLLRAGPRSAIVVQYNPFSFARWGFAPWLPALLLSLRLSRRRSLTAVMIHEPYVPMVSWRSRVMGGWQRLQLAAVRLSADVVFTSIDEWVERFRNRRPRRPVHHLPVGSNFPDRRSARDAERQSGRFAGETLVIAAIGRDDPTWCRDYVVEAVNAIAATGREVAYLHLGAHAPPLGGLDPRVDMRVPGYLDHDELAGRVAAADIFLAPLSGGISTRRGTLMVALQHGLPTVATVGPRTDAILREAGSAIALTPAGDPTLFAASALQLAEDLAGRSERSIAARRLYEVNFDWPVISQKLLAAL